MIDCMTRQFQGFGTLANVGIALMLGSCAVIAAADPPSRSAVAGFQRYTRTVETRLARQHGSLHGFLAGAAATPQDEARMRNGELIIERVVPPQGSDLPGAMLHHWRGTAFAPGATAADFERLMQDFNDFPREFSPQVMRGQVLSRNGNHLTASMRVRQSHVLTVVMDATYDISFGQLDADHGYSVSHSTSISEIESPGTAKERALSQNEEHGFLWHLNTYWSYEQRDGGLYMQVETISLTRSIPTGLAWAIRPYVESVPRESLEFTLRSARNALSNAEPQRATR